MNTAKKKILRFLQNNEISFQYNHSALCNGKDRWRGWVFFRCIKYNPCTKANKKTINTTGDRGKRSHGKHSIEYNPANTNPFKQSQLSIAKIITMKQKMIIETQTGRKMQFIHSKKIVHS